MPRIRITEQSPKAGFKYFRQGDPEPPENQPGDAECDPALPSQDWDLPQDEHGHTDFLLATVSKKRRHIDIKW